MSSLLRFESLLRAGQKAVHFMSLFVMLMIGGWMVTLAMIGCLALSESGELRKIRKRLASWRQSSARPRLLAHRALALNPQTRMRRDLDASGSRRGS